MKLSLCCKNQEIHVTILILDTDVSFLTSKFNEFQCHQTVSGTNLKKTTQKEEYTHYLS